MDLFSRCHIIWLNRLISSIIVINGLKQNVIFADKPLSLKPVYLLVKYENIVKKINWNSVNRNPYINYIKRTCEWSICIKFQRFSLIWHRECQKCQNHLLDVCALLLRCDSHDQTRANILPIDYPSLVSNRNKKYSLRYCTEKAVHMDGETDKQTDRWGGNNISSAFATEGRWNKWIHWKINVTCNNSHGGIPVPVMHLVWREMMTLRYALLRYALQLIMNKR